MSIAEERSLATDSGRRRAPAVAPNRPHRAQPPESTRSASPASASASTALTMASIRISRGNPTPEETAAVAALLVASLRLRHEAGPSAAEPRIHKLPHRRSPTYRAPGSWAS
ncbi:acyl-CoA carboxylase epsilon subunit [Streptomyces nojiriensis]|uniref:acyl-CoA carboxylase epsilon subunit n=1 Tax=Streptomyces nojiriensis TaxID=66374 RepID=UPI0035D55C7E